jgi:HK97 family phage major capsid protein
MSRWPMPRLASAASVSEIGASAFSTASSEGEAPSASRIGVAIKAAPHLFKSDEEEHERLRELVRQGKVEREAGATFGTPRTGPTDGPNAPVSDIRSAALSANERAEFLPERAREHMERQLRQDDDPQGRLAQITTALADRDYFRAFSKVFNDPVSGGHEWTPEEREAVRKVRWLERSMTLGTGSAGGFLVPYELDSSIVLTASYADPIRQIARVETTALNEKRFVTSAGSTSSWDPEETEVSDDSPVLSQPSVAAKKAMTWIPVSFELFEDSAIAQEVGRVFADSKAAHESLSFTLTQTNGPVGVVSAIVTSGAPQVIATGTNAFALGDIYQNNNNLPARWRGNASWMANQAVINAFRQLPIGSGLQQSIVDDSGDVPRILGRPVYENSNMDGTLNASAADYALLFGDFSQYVVLDRIGATLELVPQLLGANRRPSGQRGFLQHWRVGADVLVPAAFSLTNYSG